MNFQLFILEKMGLLTWLFSLSTYANAKKFKLSRIYKYYQN